MTPLQKIAMGLVIVMVDAYLFGFDAVPDVLGWALVITGLVDLRSRLDGFGALTALAGLSGLVALALLLPRLASLPESSGWLLSLPQLVFSILLCVGVARLAGSDPEVGQRFSWLRWVFVVLVLGPGAVYGGGVDLLLIPVAVTTVAANVYLIYLLFKIARRPYATPTARADVGID